VVLGRAPLEAVPSWELGSSRVPTLVFLGKQAGSECGKFLCPAPKFLLPRIVCVESIVANMKQGWTWSDNVFFLQRICQSCFEMCIYKTVNSLTFECCNKNRWH